MISLTPASRSGLFTVVSVLSLLKVMGRGVRWHLMCGGI